MAEIYKNLSISFFGNPESRGTSLAPFTYVARADVTKRAADGGIMALAKRLIAALLLTAAAALLLASSALAGERVGVVTNIEGRPRSRV